MESKYRNIISKIFEKTYYYLSYSLIYVFSLVIGLVFLTFAGASVMVFDLHEKIDHERYKEKVKIFKFFKDNIISNSLKYLKVSLLYTSLILILAVDLFYFSTSINPLFTAMFYINIIMTFILINSMALSFYLMEKYPEIKFKEIAKNAISLTIVHMVDILVLNVFLIVIAYLLSRVSGILLILILPGIAINLSYKFYVKMLDKKSITYLIFNLN
ncbi:hypothetical protein [Anaerococcus urinomassiliensis]|uniref:hypothetical protein n=1 Tax=Anaerococcus urinomassiliensis TaxID=1745712 RepID=UPI00093EA59D|nr:hypothetical protein [Anaerococcus urinomassiliensis]